MNNEIMKIEDLGWNKFFEEKRAELGLGDFEVARVVSEQRGAYRVRSKNGDFLAKIRGKQMFRAASREDFPAVGDWVAIEEVAADQAVIEAVLSRKSIIKRRFGDRNRSGQKNEVQVIAANIDAAFLVQAVGRDYSINRFERYLAIIQDSDVQPVIIINKIDLIGQEELEQIILEIKNRLGEIEVIATSTLQGVGLDQLENYLEKGKTYCFLGSSGVGKSSLINRLLGTNNIKTGDISDYSARGKHVTTSREMYFLTGGAIVIDNPGIREVGLTNVEAGVSNLFDEIESLAGKCQYADCTHVHEPGCEVLAAVAEGRLDKERYDNYINLKKETEFTEMNEWEKREKNRSFGKFLKNAKKDLKTFRHKDY